MVKRIIVAAAFLIIAGFMALNPAGAGDGDIRLASFGTGPLEVRLYTSYFCRPCRALEPALDPLLKNLVEQGKIRLTLIDIPGGHESRLYVHYFLYALKADNSFERALAVRVLLFEAACRGNITTEDDLAELFRKNDIACEKFDATPLYPRLNELIEGDGIRSTPTLVIVNDGKKKAVTGGAKIINAVTALRDSGK